MKLNNKGFTLVEVLAVIVILGILAVVMVPTITNLIKNNQEENMKSLEKSIISAAKVYISDNRYNIMLDNNTCDGTVTERSITKINNISISGNELSVLTLVNSGYLNDGNDIIINPKNDNEKLELDNSYVIVKYSCSTRDYEFSLDDNSLKWITLENNES